MMRGVKARLFGPGSPATGEQAELAVRDGEIEVRTDASSHRAAIATLGVREVGVDQSGLEFEWRTAEGLRAVQVTDADAVQALRSHPALSSAPQILALHSKQRRSRLGRAMGWSALGAFVLLPVLLLLLFFWQSDRIALAVAARIPIEQEIKLGDQAFGSMRATLNLQDSGPAYEALQTLGARLTKGSRYSYRFHLAKNEQINAFALPGGIVVVHTGLIEATRRPEELAGVLAHEIQHVEQRHSLQAVLKELGLRGLWLLITGDIGGTVFSQAALQLTALTFSRSAEAQADAAGFDALVSQGVDPSGMADFFATLAKKQDEAPAFLSTHPASADREQRLRARQSALAQRNFSPLQLGSWPP